MEQVVLQCKYNPTTFSRGLQLLSKVVNPGRLTKYSDVESGIALWQENVETLERQFGESLSPKMKSAILLNAMPTGLQDQVMQHMPPEAGYESIRDMIRRFAARKLESSGPTAMDIGAVDTWGKPVGITAGRAMGRGPVDISARDIIGRKGQRV